MYYDPNYDEMCMMALIHPAVEVVLASLFVEFLLQTRSSVTFSPFSLPKTGKDSGRLFTHFLRRVTR